MQPNIAPTSKASSTLQLRADTVSRIDAAFTAPLLLESGVTPQAARVLPDGTLEIAFSNGAVLLVSQYNPTQPPLLVAQDGTPIAFAHLLSAPDVAEPHLNQQVFIELVPGETQQLDFSLMDPSGLRLENGALVISFDNGGEIVLQNYAAAMAADAATAIILADGVTLTLTELPEVLATVVGLENIETAAGDAGGAAGRGGYGFQSSFAVDALAGLDPIGAINPTELAYDTQDRRPEVLDIDILAATPTNGAPIVDINDERMKEDTTAQIDLSIRPANASHSLTIAISGFTAGWTVDTSVSGGTYDPASGTWTVTLPAGVAFRGGPMVTPPHNSDADLTNLVVTTTVTRPDGETSQHTSPFSIIVDAVADAPTVTVADIPDQYWYVKNKGYEVPLHIDAAVTDTDGSEQLSHIIIDLTQPFTMPAGGFVSLVDMGITLNMGTEVSPGIWRIDINAQTGDAALDGLAMIVPNDQNYQAIHQSVTGGHTVYIPVAVYSAEVNLSGSEYDAADNTNNSATQGDFRFYITPLVLDLDGDGYDLVARSSGVMFDMNNDGLRDSTSWVGADDGLLALDVNGDGVINNQSELFGNGPDLADGFAALALHDANGDGRIDSQDDVYADLRVWRDLDQDGVSQSHELFSLADLGITSIGLNAAAGDGQILLEGAFSYADGRSGRIADVLFSVDAATIDAHDVLAASDALPFDSIDSAIRTPDPGAAYAMADAPDIQLPVTETA